MVYTVYRKPKVDYSAIPVKSVTVPDQSLSIKEIVRRFVRGIPADVVQRQGVYLDNEDVDLERLSRMDNTDKAYEADVMRSQNDYVAAKLEETERARQEREKEQKQQAATKGAAQGSGIVPLDNTMPVDTGLTNRKLPESK